MNTHTSVHLKLIGMVLVWGASWPWGRMLGHALPPLTGGAMRFLTASVFLLAWLFARDRWAAVKRLHAKQWLILLIAAAAGVFGYAVFFMLGLREMPAGKASVVVTLNPVLTLLLAAVLFGERLNLKIIIGMLLAVAGSMTAVTQGHPLAMFSDGIKSGEWLIFGCVVCWSAYTLIGRMLKGIDALTVTTLTSVMGAFMLLGLSLYVDGTPFQALAAMKLSGLGVLIGLAVASTVLGYAWYFEGVKALGAGNAAAYITLVPIVGMLCSAWFLGEPLHISLIGGCLAAVSGMALMQWGQRS